MSESASHCILCASRRVFQVAYRNGLSVVECGECGLLCGKNSGVSGFENSGAVETDPNHFVMLKTDYADLTEILERLILRRLPAIERLLGTPPKNWIEVGPGSGLMSDILTKRDAYWLGVEIDKDMAAYMQSGGKNVVHADFSSVNVAAIIPEKIKMLGGFDVIFFSQVFEHVTAPTKFLENAIACLRPNGVIYLDVPNNFGLTAVLRRLNPMASGYGEIVPPHHMIAYNPQTLRFALEQAGFKDILTFARTYNDPVFGLAHAHLWNDTKLKWVWAAAKLLGMGGNLVAMARKP